MRNVIICLALSCFLMLCGCAKSEKTESAAQTEEKQNNTSSADADDENIISEDVQELMGTIISVRAYGASSEKGVADAFARAAELEQIFSPTIENSEINAVNSAARSAPGTAVGVSEEFGEVLQRALYFSELTDGALDCSIGRLIDLWGIGTVNAKLPKQFEIDNCLIPDSWKQIHYDAQKHTVTFDTDSPELNFGAIAKGYISDEMKKALESAGVKSAVMSLGGNVMTLGNKPDGSNWTVAVTDPFNVSDVTASVRVRDYAVVTSGNYEKYFEQDGVRYHHILDSSTGYPSESDAVSTTILSECGMDCDALSTAVYILGSERGMELINSLDGFEAVIICEDGKILTSEHMNEYDFKVIN